MSGSRNPSEYPGFGKRIDLQSVSPVNFIGKSVSNDKEWVLLARNVEYVFRENLTAGHKKNNSVGERKSKDRLAIAGNELRCWNI